MFGAGGGGLWLDGMFFVTFLIIMSYGGERGRRPSRGVFNRSISNSVQYTISMFLSSDVNC